MTDVLRAALLDDERSYAEVSRQTGLTRPSLMAFGKGRQSLRLDLADRLAVFYGLELTHRGEQS